MTAPIDDAVATICAQVNESCAHLSEGERRQVIAQVADALRLIDADAVDFELEES